MELRSIDYVKPRLGNMGDWQGRHKQAVCVPHGPEKPIVGLLGAWIDYARLHQGRYESGIGEDGVLGPQWAAIGSAIRGLLNGETGRLDCGSLDTVIYENLAAEGFVPEML